MRILIVDDHRIFLDTLRSTLESAGLSVVGAASNGRDAVACAHETAPELVIMDISMPELNGIEATRRLTRELPQTKVLALSMKSDRYSILAMFEAGARGYLCKSAASASELLQAIQVVAAGHKYVSPAIAAAVLEGSVERASIGVSKRVLLRAAGARRPITLREREVLQLLAEGKSSKEIAENLKLALPTVETHRRQIMNKLGLRSIAQLTKYAVREGLTPLEPY